MFTVRRVTPGECYEQDARRARDLGACPVPGWPDVPPSTRAAYERIATLENRIAALEESAKTAWL